MTDGSHPRAARLAVDLGFASAQVTLVDGGLAPSAVVVTGPVEGTARILTHELVHAEMKAWVAYDALPTWFNEGPRRSSRTSRAATPTPHRRTST